MKRIYLLVLVSVISLGNSINAASKFICDFETNAENAQWVLNAGSRGRTSPNKWRIGDNKGFAGNSKGLYISSLPDTTKNTYIADTSCITVAYRKIKLDAGSYTLSFNWLCYGQIQEGVYVGYTEDENIIATDLNSTWSTTSLPIPTYLQTTPINNRVTTWQSKQININITREEGVLFIVWVNRIGSPIFPAAAIDNIEIYQGACPSPSGVTYDKEKNILSWSGSSDYTYEVVVYNSFTEKSTTYDKIDSTSLALPPLVDEGLYYFYVRTINNIEKTHSAWEYTEQFMWVKGVRCIDFFDLTKDNSGVAKCFSNADDGNKCNNYDECIHDVAGQIDYGPDNENSMHTVLYVQGQVDERTNGKLRTIPEGELAAIRINGFWKKKGYHAACVEYEHPVIEGVSDILVLKYAAVLENPIDHLEDQRPRLRLQILKGEEIMDSCAQGDFRAGFGDTRKWHSIKYTIGPNIDKDSILWSDWTTIRVSLKKYVGNTLTLRLAAYDCEPSGHFGYGYFTLDCESSDMKNKVNCGDFSLDYFEAPDGFNYRWYKPDAPNDILSTERIFNIDKKDTNVYNVDIINPERTGCFYTLVADPNPQYPQAQFSYESKPANCVNTVNFTNLSAVVQINRENFRIIKKETPIDSVKWDFGDGSDTLITSNKKFTHDFPQEGGKFIVTCFVEMSDGLCKDTFAQEIELPDIRPKDSIESITICEDSFIDSKGIIHYLDSEVYFVDTTKVITSKYGCTEYHIIHYKLAKKYDTTYVDTICQYDPYYWEGNHKYYDSTVFVTERFVSIDGCDSITSLNLFAVTALRVNLLDVPDVCIDVPYLFIPYEVTSGELDSINVHIPYSLKPYGFEQNIYSFTHGDTVQIKLPKTLLANKYFVNIEFKNEKCGIPPQPIYFNVLYSSNIAIQKSGFIAIQNEKYNGGNYKFQYYQWYRNGRPIWGADQSYIPVSDNDIDTVFEILLGRKDIDEVLFSCPIIYDAGASRLNDLPETRLNKTTTKQLISPTRVKQGNQVTILIDEDFTLYSVDGKQIQQHHVNESRSFNAPQVPGLYILRFNNNRCTKLIVY